MTRTNHSTNDTKNCPLCRTPWVYVGMIEAECNGPGCSNNPSKPAIAKAREYIWCFHDGGQRRWQHIQASNWGTAINYAREREAHGIAVYFPKPHPDAINVEMDGVTLKNFPDELMYPPGPPVPAKYAGPGYAGPGYASRTMQKLAGAPTPRNPRPTPIDDDDDEEDDPI